MRTCPACDTICHDSDESCSECGRNLKSGLTPLKPLPPENREAKDAFAKAIPAIIACAAFIYAYVSCSSGDKAKSKPDVVETVMTIDSDGFCGPRDTILEMYAAHEKGDQRGALAMANKPGVHLVLKGERALGVPRGELMTIVTMQTGSARGENCWLPSALLR